MGVLFSSTELSWISSSCVFWNYDIYFVGDKEKELFFMVACPSCSKTRPKSSFAYLPTFINFLYPCLLDFLMLKIYKDPLSGSTNWLYWLSCLLGDWGGIWILLLRLPCYDRRLSWSLITTKSRELSWESRLIAYPWRWRFCSPLIILSATTGWETLRFETF